MSSNLLTPKQRIGRAINAASRDGKREKSEASLFIALLIGAVAAFGLIILANSDPSDTAISGAPSAPIDSRN